MPDQPADCGVIGGGVIGLSIARELACRGLSVVVLAGGVSRDSSSWAAAGILPPAPMPADPATYPGATLTAMSDRLQRRWADELRDETGIDNGLRVSGGLHLAGDEAGLAAIAAEDADWRARGARSELIGAADIRRIEPALAAAVDAGRVVGGLVLADEMQIRPPRHLEAVRASCIRRGVTIREGVEAVAFETTPGRLAAVHTASGSVHADRWVVAAGAWSQALLPGLGLAVSTKPIRGQIVLVNPGRPVLSRIVNRGLDYLLQREDGRLLVGSTIEDAGFHTLTTPAAIERLLGVLRDLVPSAGDAPVEIAWAGLRPGSGDGLPFIGFVPGFTNAVVAAGHFRAGIHQSTGTAVLVAELLTGARPSLDLAAFAPDRVVDTSAAGGVGDYLARAAAGS